MGRGLGRARSGARAGACSEWGAGWGGESESELEQRLGDLNGVQRGALSQVVPDDEQRQPLTARTNPADVRGIPSCGRERRWEVIHNHTGRYGQKGPRLIW